MRNSLRLARKAAQITQEQLARMAGVTIAVISRLEKELDEDEPRITVTYETAVRIARALHVAPEDVFVVKDLALRPEPTPKRKGRPSAKHRQRLKVVKTALLAGNKREDAHVG